MLSARVWLGWGPPALYLELVCMCVRVCVCAHLRVYVSFWMLLRIHPGLFQGGLGEAGHWVGRGRVSGAQQGWGHLSWGEWGPKIDWPLTFVYIIVFFWYFGCAESSLPWAIFSSCGERGCSVIVLGLLTGVASLVVEQGLQASVVAVPGCSSQAQ